VAAYTHPCIISFFSYPSAHPTPFISFFFFNDPAPTEIYTLSLHDALPICRQSGGHRPRLQRADSDYEQSRARFNLHVTRRGRAQDRKSTRLNSSHRTISYAVFCLKKKKKKQKNIQTNKLCNYR